MPDLDDILEPHRDAAEERYYTPGVFQDHWHMGAEDGFLAGARHALTEPIILRTPEELDALPVGSWVLDGGNPAYVCVKRPSGRWMAPDSLEPEDASRMALPVELIRLPKEEA